MEGVKLVATTQSLFCTRIEWALKLKGVEYEYIEEDLRNKSPILLKYNPVHKKVPVFVHDDRAIAESLVILEYIDETWKEHPLLPQDSYDRAIARFWAKFADEKVVFGAWRACTAAEGEEKEKAIESALESLAYLEKQIEGKKFFGGEEIGYLDLALGWIPHWLNTMEEAGGMKLLEAERFPSLHEWGHNFIQIPLIKECLPPREKLVNYLNASLTYLRSLSANKP
ncbi:hypothetical protein PRUPE_5G228000 [Prunus persica]|uniref:Glutathione S-transferase n=2 Tax=Prunus TaxID=3754 RepID=A0A5E4G057_PRUDU|nr:probable glutathione S-transferase [Prunus persica]XP_034214787.1 probable glutathione S-transferase [Prunus dulcis]ONI09272.1 hypothetical protein PRUPE_5G228000 [Prunus persica]VVA33052.1 PREDICTED: glutathione [Prunus dulcis]